MELKNLRMKLTREKPIDQQIRVLEGLVSKKEAQVSRAREQVQKANADLNMHQQELQSAHHQLMEARALMATDNNIEKKIKEAVRG
eukprot:2430929-Karenia_brevis.AAC.1